MLLTGSQSKDTSKRILFLSGVANPERPESLEEALNGKKGGALRALSVTDGKRLAEYRLDALPVYDGMAATSGRIYIALSDGSVVCFSDK
jgi:hypothetical protein